MKFQGASLTSAFLVIIIFACLISPGPAYNAFLYKNYTIRYDRGWDILCDPYIVKKNDWIYKLFREKGEISQKDFPEFLRLFKRLNPHIHNMDHIRPGQHILIPLKKLTQGSMPGQSSGMVTIPFVTIPNAPKDLKKYSAKHTVQKGDLVSMLISKKYGPFGTESYKHGIKLFKLVNPDVKDLDRILIGQTLHIPDPAILSQPWYQSLFDGSADNKNRVDADDSILTGKKTPEDFISSKMEKKSSSPLSEVARFLNANLFNKGVYYFPRPGQEDFKLDLSKIPFMEFEKGTRILFSTVNNNQKSVLDSKLDIVKSFWKDVVIVRVAPNDSVEQIFDAVFEKIGSHGLKNRLSFLDHGVKVEVRGRWIYEAPVESGNIVRHFCISLIDTVDERTPESILRYLDQNNIVIKEILKDKHRSPKKSNSPPSHQSGQDVSTIDFSDRKTFVNDLMTVMGYNYSPNVSVSFPYAGVQVKAASNLVSGSDGSSFLVDFGDLYGDAVHAIEKTGFNIIQIKNDDHYPVIIQKILSAMDVSYTNDPSFLAAKRPTTHNTTLAIPGILVDSEGKSKTLLSFAKLNKGIIRFLTDQNVKIIMIEPPVKTGIEST